MRLDDILDEIGGFGRYQKWIFFLTCLPNFIAGFFMLNPVFLLGIPDHRCAIPGYDNDTYDVQGNEHQELINSFIPKSSSEGEEYARCKVFEYQSDNSSSIYNRSYVLAENSTRQEIKCNIWVYDKSVFDNTFAAQENLVCDKEIWVANTEMIFYGGMLVGSLASGIIADSHGRKPVMYVAVLLMVASSIGLAWVHTYWLFCIVEFLLGGSIVATFMPAYIISLEITSAKKRVWPGVVSELPYVLGLVLLAAIAYALRDWYKIQLYTSLPGVVFVFYWWLMPESPRWLLTKGRVKEAEAILRTAARWNKATLPDKLFDKDTVEEECEADASFIQLFSTKTMCFRSILIFFNWLVVALVYFGLALNSENLNGNLYLNFGLSGIVEIPGYVLVVLLVDRFGRRRLYCVWMIIGGVACLCTVFSIEYEPEDAFCVSLPTRGRTGSTQARSRVYWCFTSDMLKNQDICSIRGSDILTIALSMFGRLCVTGAYSVAYIHSAELFPTVIRNAGMGGASVFARVGTMIAPYIVTVSDSFGGFLKEALPLIIFGGMALLSGLLSLLLPETLNKHLPETVGDGERFGRSGAFYFVRSLRLHQNESTREGHDPEHEFLLSTEKSNYSTENELLQSSDKV